MTDGHTPDLIERVERATGPSRALDGDIAALLSLQPQWAINRHERQPELFSDDGPGLRAKTWLAPKFTASVDAAMSLMPGGRRMTVQQRRSYEPFWVSFMLDGGTEYDATGKAATLALAITAASLKARAIP